MFVHQALRKLARENNVSVAHCRKMFGICKKTMPTKLALKTVVELVIEIKKAEAVNVDVSGEGIIVGGPEHAG